MNGLKSIIESWRSYAATALPPDASDVQRLETRRAFYAGAWAALCQTRRIGDDDITEEVGSQHLYSLVAECQAFNQRVKEGKA